MLTSWQYWVLVDITHKILSKELVTGESIMEVSGGFAIDIISGSLF